jgi:uncharacterized protein (DUF433 family)
LLCEQILALHAVADLGVDFAGHTISLSPFAPKRASGILAESTLRRYRRCVNYEHLITVEPGKRSGKPCIRGMRITVYDVLEYLASGMTEDEILADFSELTREDIKACLAFAADRERKLFPPAA